MMSIKKAPTGGNRIGAKQEGLRTHPVPIVTHVCRSRKRVRFRRTTINEILAITVCVVLLGGLLHIGIRLLVQGLIALYGW